MNMLDTKTDTPSHGAAQHKAMKHKGHAIPFSPKQKGAVVNNFGKNKGNTMGKGKC